MNVELAQIISQILALLVIYFAMKKWAWKPFLAILEERRQKIASEFAEIDRKKEETETLHKEYLQKLSETESLARREIDKAIQEGRKIAEEIQKKAQQEAVDFLKKADAQLALETAKTKKALREEVVSLSVQIAGKIIEERLDSNKERDLAKKYLDKAEWS